MSLFMGASLRAQHPVDIVEDMASANEWAFDRDGEDELAVVVGGVWSDYHVSFTWLEDVEALHLACAFDIKRNPRRESEILRLIALINEQLWVGHMGFWKQEGMIIFRHAIVLTGGTIPSPVQCEAVMAAAVSACERYYQAFQFVLWAGKTAEEAIEGAMIETEGEA